VAVVEQTELQVVLRLDGVQVEEVLELTIPLLPLLVVPEQTVLSLPLNTTRRFMKYFLLLIISFPAMAAPEFYPVGKSGVGSYIDKDLCELKEAQACYNITKCPLDVCELYNVIEDGVEKVVLSENPVKKDALEDEASSKKYNCENFKGVTNNQIENFVDNIGTVQGKNTFKNVLKLIRDCI
jgi:hypothetical protein